MIELRWLHVRGIPKNGDLPTIFGQQHYQRLQYRIITPIPNAEAEWQDVPLIFEKGVANEGSD